MKRREIKKKQKRKGKEKKIGIINDMQEWLVQKDIKLELIQLLKD